MTTVINSFTSSHFGWSQNSLKTFHNTQIPWSGFKQKANLMLMFMPRVHLLILFTGVSPKHNKICFHFFFRRLFTLVSKHFYKERKKSCVTFFLTAPKKQRTRRKKENQRDNQNKKKLFSLFSPSIRNNFLPACLLGWNFCGFFFFR